MSRFTYVELYESNEPKFGPFDPTLIPLSAATLVAGAVLSAPFIGASILAGLTYALIEPDNAA